MNYRKNKFFHFIYPLGKPMPPHFLRCQGLVVGYYSFAPGRLETGAPSTFAQPGVPSLDKIKFLI